MTVFVQGALGGGGFVTSIKISPDGLTRLITTDVYGSYIWNSSTSKWEQLYSASRLPSTFPFGRNGFSYQGYAVAVAPSNSSIIYMIGTGTSRWATSCWKSTNRGQTFTETAKIDFGATTAAFDRTYGPKLVVDPANPDVVYAGDSTGIVFRTFDGGSTWERVDALIAALTTATTNAGTASNSSVLHFASTPAAVTDLATNTWQQMFAYDVTKPSAVGTGIANLVLAAAATTVTLQQTAGAFIAGTPAVDSGDQIVFGSGPVIAFDPTSGTTGGRTNKIYFGWAVGAQGVWKTADAGATFSGPMASSPVSVVHFCMSHDGVLYATDNDAVRTTNAWRLMSGSWTNLAAAAASTYGARWHAPAADPLNAGHVVFGMEPGNINRSDDYGANFYGSYGSAAIRVSTDIPWMAYTNEDSMSSGDICFDTQVSNKLWFAEGIGVWTTSPLANANRPTWSAVTVGNEELIVDQIIAPPSGGVVVAVQDRGFLHCASPTVYPSTNFAPQGALVALSHGWSVDWAKNNPSYLIGVSNGVIWSSADKGETWTEKATPGGLAGAIACQSSTNSVWIPLNGTSPKYTTDGGANWTDCLFAGSTLSTGWSFSAFLDRQLVCADHVESQTYYAFNQSNGLYRSTDGGANFVLMANTTGLLIDSGVGMALVASHYNQGHLLLSGGALNGPTISQRELRRSVDGGATWVTVSSTYNVWQADFGKPAQGKSYPAIYITGYVDAVTAPGVFRCDDATTDVNGALTWTRLTSAPADNLDSPHSLAASLDTWGTVYIGMGASGYVSGAEDIEPEPEPTPTPVEIHIDPQGDRIIAHRPGGPHLSRKRFHEIMEAEAALRAVEHRAERLKSRPAKKALSRAAIEAAQAIAVAKETEVSTARMTAALEAARSASDLAETIRQANLAIQYAQEIQDIEDEAIVLLMLH